MKPFRFAVCVLVVGIAFAVFGGGDWQTVAFGGVVGALVAAMLETMPLLDWHYPKDENAPPHDD